MKRVYLFLVGMLVVAVPLRACAAEESSTVSAKVLPRVLIIGDSVSLGYMPTVVEALKGKAEVLHNQDPDNAGSTKGGIDKIDQWVGDGNWDVIHFNWGLWDINRRVDGKRNVDGPITTSPADYEQRLDALVTRLKQTRAKLIWAPITFCSGGWGRRKGDDVTFNTIAAKVMAKHGVATDDLHALTSAFPPELFKSAGNVHFSEEGYRRLGEAVAAAIGEVLPK